MTPHDATLAELVRRLADAVVVADADPMPRRSRGGGRR
jgi:hypothetical protein